MEPEFISQCADPKTPDEKREWFDAAAKEAIAQGATYHRFAIHETIPHLILYEGWKIDPGPGKEGEPRWQFTAVGPMRDFPPGAQELWDILAKALMLRAGGAVTISKTERNAAADTEAEIQLNDDGSIIFRVESN